MQSSLTLAKFCDQEQILVASFYQWKRRFEIQSDAAVKRRRAKQPTSIENGFTSLVATPTKPSAEVTLPGGASISLGHETEMATLIIDRLLRHNLSGLGDHPEDQGPSSC